MAEEDIVLRALINGGQPKAKIPLAGNLCNEAGRALEKRGLLQRGDHWKLTKEGIMYALQQGISPKPYDIEKELPPLPPDVVIPSFHTHMHNVDKQPRSAAIYYAKCLMVGLVIGLAILLAEQLTGYARVLW